MLLQDPVCLSRSTAPHLFESWRTSHRCSLYGQQTSQGLDPITTPTCPFLLDGHGHCHLIPLQNVRLTLPPALITSQTASSILCLRVSRYDAGWVFSPACNASQLCCIQAASFSHILSLRWSTVIGPPFFRCVRVTLICDREPQLTGITAGVLAHWVIFSTLSLF
jgi:hypothetical protein